MVPLPFFYASLFGRALAGICGGFGAVALSIYERDWTDVLACSLNARTGERICSDDALGYGSGLQDVRCDRAAL